MAIGSLVPFWPSGAGATRRFLLIGIVASCVSCVASVRLTRPEEDARRNSRIDRDRVGIVLIDAQPAFIEIMNGPKEPVLARLEQLLILASTTRRPLLATFEDSPRENGWLPERLESVFPAHGLRFVKQSFDCCREDDIRTALLDLNVDQVVVAGAETDVCVLQSVLGLLDLGFEVFILEDCLFSHEGNTLPALERMKAAGAIPSTFKTFFFEMAEGVGEDSVPAAWRRREGAWKARFRSPYSLPPSPPRR